MMFGEVPLADAEGAVLAHSLMLGDRRVPKGTLVDSALIAAAVKAGVARLWIARAEDGDIPEAEAARVIGQALAGTGTVARAPVHGRVNLHATHDGLLNMDASAITVANEQTDAVGIATLAPNTPVKAGDLVATVKIIPFAISAIERGDVLAPRPLIEVLPWRNCGPVLLVQTERNDTSAKMMTKTAEVTRQRLVRFGWPMVEAEVVPHAIAPLADALNGARAEFGMILIAGATATADRRDVIPAAIAAAGGQVSRVGMPVDPGNLLVLGGFFDGAMVIGLPGCARSPKRNGFDLILEQLAAFGSINWDTIARMGVGGLLEGSGVPVPWAWQP